MSARYNQNQELSQRLAELRGDDIGNADIGEITCVVESIMTSLRGDLSSVDLKLYAELEALAEYIQHAKLEIAALRPDEIKDRIPSATDELDAVVLATETATNSIMDAVEDIENMTVQMSEEVGRKVSEYVTSIYEACNFQDISGQRITKVVSTLRHIETTVEELLMAFGEEVRQGTNQSSQEKDATVDEEQSLLNGPQLPEEANRQADIDALLAEFD